jgi:type VI protein secretion system component Hcp
MNTLQDLTRFNMAWARMNRLKRIIYLAAALSVVASLPAQTVKSTATIQSPNLGCTTSLGSGTFTTLSWLLGGTNNINAIVGSGTQYKATLQNLSLTKLFDECSGALFKSVMTGSHMGAVTLTQHDATTNASVIRIDLQDAVVASYELAGSTASSQHSEQVSLTYSKITITHVPSGARFCWDARSSAGC